MTKKGTSTEESKRFLIEYIWPEVLFPALLILTFAQIELDGAGSSDSLYTYIYGALAGLSLIYAIWYLFKMRTRFAGRWVAALIYAVTVTVMLLLWNTDLSRFLVFVSYMAYVLIVYFMPLRNASSEDSQGALGRNR